MLLSRAKLIKLVAFDVDGVMTDGGLYLSDSGNEFKRFNTLDGLGIKLLKASGIEVAIITGRTSTCVTLRAQNLASNTSIKAWNTSSMP
jgi:3-deoxy-D-manno-octulosonate 8-phosphate phosphatase (KDO 8-P phosphatase)